jgi:6-phosphogluconolactonase (cycloisomerase 2 family)
MFRIVVVLLAAVLAAMPASAGTILYATAATPGRIDGFCLGDNGALAPSPKVSVTTSGARPRRLVVANGVLYAAETDRVEAYSIGPRGGLTRIGRTKALKDMHPDDLAIAPDFTHIYVPQRAFTRVAAYRLGPDGAPEENFSSCVQGAVGVGYSRVSSTSGNGAISIFKLGSDGSLPATDCHLATKGRSRSDRTTPYALRTNLHTPESFIIDGDTIYVEQRGAKRIAAFRLEADGAWACPTTKDGGPAVNDTLKCPCLDPTDTKTCPTKKLKQQKSLSRTNTVFPYTDLLLEGSTLIGSQFFHGRVDAYVINSDGTLPKSPSGTTEEDVRMSPVRMTVSADGRTLYVSAGEDDRIRAYRLNDRNLPAATPFSETDVSKGSFPNEVAIAMLPEGCD